jgi:hypothetical protein
MVIKSWLIVKLLTLFHFGEAVGVTVPPFIFILPNQENERQIINHEQIHLSQARDYWYLGFYGIYTYYNIIGMFKYQSMEDAYFNNPLEVEAYENETDYDYIYLRKPYSHLNYLDINEY